MAREELESVVRDPQNPENAAVAARVYADPKLWPAFEQALYPDATTTDEERQTIRRFVADHCRSDASSRQNLLLHNFVAERLERISGGMGAFALAAASRDGAGADNSSEDGETVTFVFVSDPSGDWADRRLSWRAEMALPPNAAVDEMLAIELADGERNPVDGGIFKIAGVALPVTHGRAEIPYGQFLSGIKDAQVELLTAEGIRSSGTLALF